MEERTVSVGVLQSADLVTPSVHTAEPEPVQTLRPASDWSQGKFAREQIRGLVRQVFFSSVQPVRQVVFCAAESSTEIGSMCWRIAEALALDTSAAVAMVKSDFSDDRPSSQSSSAELENTKVTMATGTTLRQSALRIQKNLWLLPQIHLLDDGEVPRTLLSSRLNELRREFEYSIVQGPSAGDSSEATALGQSADGIVLVLAAHLTRRATALKIKETLQAAQVRLLGTILSQRRFPIPEAIYRRL
jgi:hypothetical protein